MTTTGGNKGSNWSKLISVSSSQRVNPQNSTTTNFTFNTGQNLQNVIRVSIPTASFFNNFYNIVNDSTGNNTTYSYQWNGGGTVTFTLTPGFYSLSTILAQMNADLVTSTGGAVSWTFNPNTNLVSLNVNAGSTFVLNAGAAPLLGLMTTLGGGPFILTPNTITGAAVVTGSNFPKLSSPTQVYIRSAALAPSNGFDGSGRFSNTLLAIPVSVPFNTLNVFECKQDELCEVTYSRPRDLNNIDIQLTDRFGNVLDLHDGTLNIELKVWFNNF